MAVADSSLLLQERRQLLAHVLQLEVQRGAVRLQLPIGVAAAEPWLLDAVDVPALLAALPARPPGPAAASPPPTLELLAFCRKGASRAVTSDPGAPSTAAGGSGRGSRPPSRRTTDAAAGEAAPVLRLPQLESGLAEGEVKDLAYLVFACSCGDSESLLATMRGQLGIDEARAADVARLLGRVRASMREAAGPLPLSESWSASLELPVCLLSVLLPQDFRRFRAFVAWRDTLSHVLLTTLSQAVREGWRQSAGSPGSTAQQLMARLKAALRRGDVRDADDFDALEYSAASAAVREHTGAIVQATVSGWAFPWGLRVRLYEALCGCVFDALDEAAYVEGARDVLRLLETRLRPLLGLGPGTAAAVLAWSHFRQYACTQAPHLLGETKAQLQQLAALAAPARADAAAGSADDSLLAHEVGVAVEGWLRQRLSDYHCGLEALGGVDALPGLVDLAAFAAASRGAGTEEVGELLAAALRSSVRAELARRLAAEARSSSASDASCGGREGSASAQHVAAVCRAAAGLAAEQERWASGFTAQLPEALALALAVLQDAVSSSLLPWLAGRPALDEDTCEALRAALELEPVLLGPLRAAMASCRFAASYRTLAAVCPWDVRGRMEPLLGVWLDKQAASFSLWVDRHLQGEDWRPLGTQQAHAASARDLRTIALDSLEALDSLGLPLSPATLARSLHSIGAMMTRYLDAILTVLGSEAVMVPPTPPLARFKREVAVKQEEAEAAMPGLPHVLPPPGSLGRKRRPFVESVRRIEAEPCAARVGGLGSSELCVMLASLAYLRDTLQLVAEAVAQLRNADLDGSGRVSSAGGAGLPPAPAAGAAGFSSSSTVSNPFSQGPCPGGGSANSSGLDCAPGPLSAARNGGGAAPLWAQQAPPQAGWWGSGGGAEPQPRPGSSWRGNDQLGSLQQATEQRLGAGIARVTKWLAVRVVWWEQRAGWCELLYRHRVTLCRMDWLLDGLRSALSNVACLLPQEPCQAVAAAVLREAALVLERALLDGGPCRWFVPADAAHVAEDLDGLRQLFHAEAGLPLQDVNASLAGVRGVLQLMAQSTGPLIEAHKRARRAALLPGAAMPASGAPGSGGSGSGGAAGVRSARATGELGSQLGPLAAGRAGGAAGAGSEHSSRGPTPHHSRQPTGGSLYDGSSAASYAAAGAAGSSSGGGSPRGWPGRGAPPAAGGVGCMRRTALEVAAAAGAAAVEAQEPIILRVLCHRAEHAASKYLKEDIKVPKVRDETLGEALERVTVGRVLRLL